MRLKDEKSIRKDDDDNDDDDDLWNSFWAIPHQRKRHLKSYAEVREMLFSGEEVSYQVNKTQCECRKTSDQCSGIAGGKINGIKDTHILYICMYIELIDNLIEIRSFDPLP